MCINSTKGRFTVDKSGNVLSSRINVHELRTFCFLFSIVNDVLACRPFRKFRKDSKCCGEVSKTRISSTFHR